MSTSLCIYFRISVSDFNMYKHFRGNILRSLPLLLPADKKILLFLCRPNCKNLISLFIQHLYQKLYFVLSAHTTVFFKRANPKHRGNQCLANSDKKQQTGWKSQDSQTSCKTRFGVITWTCHQLFCTDFCRKTLSRA